MIIFIDQGGHAILFLGRVERVRRNIFEVDRIRIQRPKQRRDVAVVVQPGAQPKTVTSRHKFSRHFGMSRGQRLEEVKHSPISNGPGREYEGESNREQYAAEEHVPDGLSEAAFWSAAA